MAGGTHPSVVVTLARRKRELTLCDMNSERQKREEEHGYIEGHLANDDGGERRGGRGEGVSGRIPLQ